MLSDEQKKCIQFRKGLALVVATAGSGKTRVIIERCKSLIEDGNSPSSILCITFSNKAADEISKRLGDSSIWVGTFHSISFRLLIMYGVIHKDTIVLDEQDKKDIFIYLNILESLEIINKHETMGREIYDPIVLQHYKIYKEYCWSNNLIDFSQIIQVMLYSLQNNEEFRIYVTNKFSFIMVDEFQDTDKKQYEILKLIANNNLMGIGDDNQCIYAWRGADIKNILDFHKVWPDSTIFNLSTNYRCTESIAKVGLSIVQKIAKRLPQTVYAPKQGSKVEIYGTSNEGRLIAKKIKKIPENKTTAILLRSIRQLSDIENQLVINNIQYQVLMGTKFFEKAEIKTIIAYLKCIYLNDLIGLKRMLTHPRRGIGDKKITTIESAIKSGVNLYDALCSIKANGLAEQIKSWQSSTEDSGTIIKRIWEESGLQDEYEKDINVLINKAQTFPQITDFLKNIITLDSEEINIPVIITTIHSAKGLEFDYVFIPGACEGNIPHINAIRFETKEGGLDDERRVLGVGITRAKEHLCLTYNPNEKHGEYFGISRFLLPLSRDNVDFLKDESF